MAQGSTGTRMTTARREPTPRKESPMKTSPPAPRRPSWVPPGIQFEKLSPGLQRAIKTDLSPAHDELVGLAPNGFEKSAGMPSLHASGLEILEQASRAGERGPDPPAGGGAAGRDGRVGRYLRVAAA